MPEVLEVKNELARPQPINWSLLRDQALATFNIQREEIAKEVEADLKLTVTDDRTRKVAKDRQWVWVKRRTGLAKTKQSAGSEAKKIVALVAEVAESFQTEFDKPEQHLDKQISDYDAAIAKEKQDKLDAVFNARNSQLQHVGIELQRLVVESLTDDQIAKMIEEKIETDRLRKEEAERVAAAKVETDRLAAEEKERNRIESEKLAAERAEFERLKKIEDDKLAARQAVLDQQQQLIDEANEKIRKADADRVEEIARKRREAESAEADRQRQINEVQIRAEAEQRAEALRPDREKLLAFADSIDALRVPDVAPEMESVRSLCVGVVAEAAIAIRDIVGPR